MASKYWASSPQRKFNGESDAGMGYRNWSYCQPNDTKRLFYRIPVSTFAGKTILSAEPVVHNTWSRFLHGEVRGAVADEGHLLVDDVDLAERIRVLDQAAGLGLLRVRVHGLQRARMPSSA